MNKKSWLIVCLTLGILTFCGCIGLSQSPAEFQLALPIDCQLGKDCFIFHYVDVEPDEREIDVNCGRQTYNNHKGTDFGILEGDIESFTLIDPNQKVVLQEENTADKSYRNWVSYVGKKNTNNNSLITGTWIGTYQLKRNSKMIIELTEKVEVI